MRKKPPDEELEKWIKPIKREIVFAVLEKSIVERNC
jgi:hypothetical protein